MLEEPGWLRKGRVKLRFWGHPPFPPKQRLTPRCRILLRPNLPGAPGARDRSRCGKRGGTVGEGTRRGSCRFFAAFPRFPPLERALGAAGIHRELPRTDRPKNPSGRGSGRFKRTGGATAPLCASSPPHPRCSIPHPKKQNTRDPGGETPGGFTAEKARRSRKRRLEQGAGTAAGGGIHRARAAAGPDRDPGGFLSRILGRDPQQDPRGVPRPISQQNPRGIPP